MAETLLCPSCKTRNPARFNFCGHCGRRLRERAPARGESAFRAPAAAASSPERPAERRQLTVMFCDLVGSTALSLDLDPEDFGGVVRAYQTACVEVIDRFEGYVAQYLGDGILAYFGYPVAREDTAERAVRAGLGILEAVASLSRALPYGPALDLSVRVGIHTGLVVVDDMGSGDRRERLAMGTAPNIAARLQSIAEPDTVLFSDATYRLVEGRFEVEQLPGSPLKGVPDSTRVYRVTGERESEPHTGRALLVGRAAELERLLAGWSEAREGTGRAAVVWGETGMGKSFLVQAFLEAVAGTAHNLVECYGSAYYRNTAFFPFVQLLRRMLNFYPKQPAPERLDTIEFVLGRLGFEPGEYVPLFAGLLSVPAGDRYPPTPLGRRVRHEKIEAALLEVLLKLSDEQPLALVFEDLQWVDASTLALLERFAGRIADRRVFALLTSRPGLPLPWAGEERVIVCRLDRLDHAQTEELIRLSAGDRNVPPELLGQIARSTDGVPLFVHEVTRMLVESGQGAGSPSTLSIPSTLRDSLVARLDRLPEVREVVQLCATLGREFSVEVLRAVASIDEAALDRALDRLVAAELLVELGPSPGTVYRFRHALVKEAAYESQLRSRRKLLHDRIAEVIEREFEEMAETQPELLAFHFERAGRKDRAAHYARRAAERVAAPPAGEEAVG